MATKKNTKKATTSRKTTKKTSTRKTSKKSSRKKVAKRTTKRSSESPKAPKKTSRKSTKKTTRGRKAAGCGGECKTKAALPATGGSLIEGAKDCRSVDECHDFIHRLSQALDQAYGWLDDMHDQALSAEQARDLYGQQIAELQKALDADKAEIARVEKDLKTAKSGRSRGAKIDRVLAELEEARKDLRTIRSDLKRLVDGRPPTSTTRRRRKTSEPRSGGRVSEPQQPATQKIGPLAKYDVLGGAACSLASQRYDYPYQYCAPKAYPPSVAGSILGIYSQYGIVVDPSRVQVGSITPAAPNAKGKSKGKSGRARTKAESGTSARKPKTNGAGKAKTTQRASSPSTTLSTGAIGNQLKLAISRL